MQHQHVQNSLGHRAQGRREGGGGAEGKNTWGPDWFGGPEILIKHLVIVLLSRGFRGP